ncbi:hypothetical protein KKE34_04770 [Patescibacteria group bacterium]|nr:hypothetical protein [Patescibacteria group bacterium]MBU1885887.1 hypothetical protein [Patescibacteria group bacterium]
MSPQYGCSKPHLTRIITRLFKESDVALLAAAQGILNVSAFARIIQPRVEEIARKKVSSKIISMTISRFLNTLSKEEGLRKFSSSEVFIKELQELGSKNGLSMIKIKFQDNYQEEACPNRFYIVLARLAAWKVEIMSLSVLSGVLTILVDPQQAGSAIVALRGLIKREQRFNCQPKRQSRASSQTSTQASTQALG